jgi:hypothetical protein
MNFFNVGFIFLSIHFSYDMPINYVLQLVGCVFMIGGVREIVMTDKDFSVYSKPVWLIAVVSAVGLLGSLASKFGLVGSAVSNAIGIILGLGSAVIILICQQSIVKTMSGKHELVNDPSLLNGLKKTWNKMAFFTVLCIVCDFLNRILPAGNFQVYAGTVLFFSKIIMLIYVALMGVAFNRVRMDFNVMHPV